MKNTNMITTLLFSLYIGVFFVLQLTISDKTFSEFENRNLSSKPTFNISDFTNGKYNSDLDTYITDQFPYRNFWVSLKSSSEFILGKSENGLVYFADDYTLIDKFNPVDFGVVDSNLGKILNFTTAIDIPIHFALIPTQNEIYKNKLDSNKTYESQLDVLEYVTKLFTGQLSDDLDFNYPDSSADFNTKTNYSNDILEISKVTYIDLYDNLSKHNKEYIYYYSDHHWTSLGAYYGYESLSSSLDFLPPILSESNQTIVSNDFQGTTHSKSPIPWMQKDTISTYFDNQLIQVNWGLGGGLEYTLLYDETKLDTKNQYHYFIGGNPPLVIVPGTGSGTLLLIRDSFSNALVPFLTAHYESIHMVDLRTYKYPMSEYIESNFVDQVLILYSIPNFVTDKNLAFLR